jgi:SEL1 protein
MHMQAAEQGHPDAHFYLGIMHLKGLGVRRKSVQRAFSYFTLAAHAGHVLAMYNAAMLHLAGKGTVRWV